MPIDLIDDFDDFAEAIKDPPPNRPLARRIGEQGRKVCDALSNVPDWYKNTIGFPHMPLMALACEPYWADQGISPPIASPPFTGGQCAGVQYTVRVSGVAQTVPFTGQNQFVLGPVRGFRFDPVGDNFRPVLQSAGNDDAAWPLIRPAEIGQWRITEVFRTFGGVDNCGNPPPVIRPGPDPSPRNPVIPPEERPRTDPDGRPVFPIPPWPGVPGWPQIPGFPNPWTGAPPAAPFPSDGPPGDVGEPGPPQSGGNDGTGPGGADDIEGEAPVGSVVVGVVVELIEPLPKSANYDRNVYRGPCYVYFGVDGTFALEPTAVALRSPQMIFAPRDNLTSWRVAPNLGFNLRVTPYYREADLPVV